MYAHTVQHQQGFTIGSYFAFEYTEFYPDRNLLRVLLGRFNIASILLDLLADDDPAGLHHTEIRQSRPPRRSFVLVLFQQFLYRVGILLLLRLRRLILHRHPLVRRHHRVRVVLRFENPARRWRILLRRIDDRYWTLSRIVQIHDLRIGRAVPDKRAPIAADLLAELQNDRRAAEGFIVVLRLDQILIQIALVQRIVATGCRA